MSEIKRTPVGGDDSEKKKKRIIIVVVALVVALIIGAIFYFASRGEKEEDGSTEGETASTITQTEDPNAPQAPRTTERVGEDGITTTQNIAPEGLGIDPDKEVDRGLSEWDGKEPLPADPREAIKQTLTAPSTPRPMPNPENPDITDPKYGSPSDLANYFAQQTFSLCIRNDTSYTKNLRGDKLAPQATPEFAKKGFWFDKDGQHSDSWKMYASDLECNKLQAFPTIRGASIASENSIVYDVKIDQRATRTLTRGQKTSQNITPIEGKLTMVYIGDKWLASEFQIDGGKAPVMY